MKALRIFTPRTMLAQPPMTHTDVAHVTDVPQAAHDLNEAPVITRLARRLDRRSSVRRLAESILRDEHTNLAAIVPAFRSLAQKPGLNWQEQEIAAWALGRVKLSTEQKRIAAEALLPLLDRLWSLDLKSRLKVAFCRLGLLGLPAALWLYNAGGYLTYPTSGVTGSHSLWFEPLLVAPFTFLFCITILAPVVLPLSYILDDRQRNRVRARAIAALGHLHVPHGLEGTLRALFEASALNIGVCGPQIRKAAYQALPNMVDALTPEHYGRLSADTIPQLCQLLLHRDESLNRLALQALAHVGDGRAILPVKRFYERTGAPDLRRQAEALLPLLYNRQQEDNAPHILLRAAGVPETPPAMLLRPVEHNGATDSSVLLRPGIINE